MTGFRSQAGPDPQPSPLRAAWFPPGPGSPPVLSWVPIRALGGSEGFQQLPSQVARVGRARWGTGCCRGTEVCGHDLRPISSAHKAISLTQLLVKGAGCGTGAGLGRRSTGLGSGSILTALEPFYLNFGFLICRMGRLSAPTSFVKQDKITRGWRLGARSGLLGSGACSATLS